MISNAGCIYQLSENDSCGVTQKVKAQRICFTFIRCLTFIGYADQYIFMLA
jgi:hypothetical protein